MKHNAERRVYMKRMIKRAGSAFLVVLMMTVLLSAIAAAETATAYIDSFSGGVITVAAPHSGDTFAAYQVVKAARSPATNEVTFTWSPAAQAYAQSAGVTLESYRQLTDDSAEMRQFLGGFAAYVKTHQTVADAQNISASDNFCRLNVTAPGQYIVLGTGNASGAYVYQMMTASFLPDADYQVPTAFSLAAKSAAPSIAKGISDNQAGVGDTVTYTVTVTVPAYPENAANTVFSVSDRLPAGLTFGQTVSVKASDGTTVPCTGGTTPQWSFDYQAIKGFSSILITYTAVVNDQVLIGDANINTATLTFSNDPYGTGTSSLSATATLYSYGLKVLKVDMDQPGKVLSGVTFDVYLADGVTKAGTIETGTDGIGRLTGLDAGTYYLQETRTATGYVLSTERTKVEIPDRNSGTPAPDGIKEVTIQNKAARFTLPQTGGSGTLAFTAAGAVLMLTAVTVVLVNKKKEDK